MKSDSLRMYFAHSDGQCAETSERDCSSPVDPGRPNLIVPVILSGGGGSRLWPFSTKEMPKQFLPLIDNRTLFEQALDRVRDGSRFSAPIVVGSVHHAELCAGPLSDSGNDARLILEPCARNTAPAIVMAAAVARRMYGEDALIVVMPSDHVILDVAAFHDAIEKGETAARAGRLVTFGVRPTDPNTGYGYIQMSIDVSGAPEVKEVLRFVEKPALDTAEAMIASGDHLWNAGIFLFLASTLLEEAAVTCPAIAEAAQKAISAGKCDGAQITADERLLAECPSESIDCAVMEHSSRVAVVPMSPGWSDLGSWDALASLSGTASPTGPITSVDCENCYIRSDGIQIAALGVRDLIIVASRDRLLILPRGRSQEVKKLLSAMDSMAA
jgi:mannose-1-phosphate guanylyltransferase/mannose-1-phosphate guanylyltransferase/mannose-6-phosphate isomerase